MAKKKNPTDATLRNIRKTRQDHADLKRQVKALEREVSKWARALNRASDLVVTMSTTDLRLVTMVTALEQRVRKLEKARN